jgi:hypothetical protein
VWRSGSATIGNGDVSDLTLLTSQISRQPQDQRTSRNVAISTSHRPVRAVQSHPAELGWAGRCGRSSRTVANLEERAR